MKVAQYQIGIAGIIFLALLAIAPSLLGGCAENDKAPTPPIASDPIPTLAPTPPPPTSVKQEAAAPVTLTTPIRVIKNIEYGKGGNVRLLLDIYLPETPIATPMPAIIWIHGGSWFSGDKYPSKVEALAKHGFFGVSINYRLSQVAQFPAAVEDSKAAVRWLRANAKKYNVDPDRIGVWGESAGGHLALMVGSADETARLEGNGGWVESSSRVSAVASFSGLSDLTSHYKYYREVLGVVNRLLIRFMGSSPDAKPNTYALASPITHVTADDPPLLLVHGDRDTVVSFSQSEMMHQAYQKKGLQSTLIRVTGADHTFTRPGISPSPGEIEQIALSFFTKHLVPTK